MSLFWRVMRWGLVALFGVFTLGILGLLAAYLVLAPGLPSVEALREIQYQVPLRVYSRDGRLLAEYGEKRRVPLSIEDTPQAVRQAFLAAEDDRFYEHPGVDWQGVVRAVVNLLMTGEKSQGASTITMQVARNFFLSSEKTYSRKLKEVFLALKIEKELSKDQILELYLNKIYLGNRAYGVGAAAQVYYGREIQELELPQVAMIAGLPKAPSRYNPIANPERARLRRDYVLRRMHDLGYIEDEAYQVAKAAPVTARSYTPNVEGDAAYVGEMIRADVVERFGEEVAYTQGYRAYATIDAKLQQAAQSAVRDALIAYDMRHGYRGPEATVKLPPELGAETLDPLLASYGPVGPLLSGLVLQIGDSEATVYLGGGRRGVLTLEDVVWAKSYVSENVQGPEPKSLNDVLSVGDVIRVVAKPQPEEAADAGADEISTASDEQAIAETGDAETVPVEPPVHLALRQVPAVSGALVSIDPKSGAIIALSGGFDFYLSKFNRAVQAERQPGSAFKPFVYSASLEKGYTPASIINDAPVVFDDPALEAVWRPENYSGRFYGPTRLRVALAKSRNLVSIRLLRAVGVGYVHRYVKRFGFDTERLPRDLSLALGSGTVTPLELARGYSVFANGGYRVTPYVLEKIEDVEGRVIFNATPTLACELPCQALADGRNPAPGDGENTEPPGEDGVVAETDDSAANQPDDRMAGGVVGQGDESASVEVKEPEKLFMPAPRAIPAENAYQIVSMTQDVIRQGTGRRALALGRNDLSGKTGTTNDQNDAWFSGFNADVVTSVWVGFDQLRPLGAGETGAGAALPMWLEFMRVALDGKPEHVLQPPEGMVTVRIDPETGLLAGADNPNAIFETFRADEVPEKAALGRVPVVGGEGVQGGEVPAEIPEQLF